MNVPNFDKGRDDKNNHRGFIKFARNFPSNKKSIKYLSFYPIFMSHDPPDSDCLVTDTHNKCSWD